MRNGAGIPAPIFYANKFASRRRSVISARLPSYSQYIIRLWQPVTNWYSFLTD